MGGNLVRIEHFGSTSVPNLTAKPVIDLMPVVVSLEVLNEQQPVFEAMGYDWFGEFGIDGRRFLTLAEDGKRRFHVHCYQQNSLHITRHLALRDYLRVNPDIAQLYVHEKQRAASLHPNDSMAYNEEKAVWVANAEAQALAWFSKGRSKSA